MASFDAVGFLKTLPLLPGVYKMQDEAGQIIYVGKAKSLKKRLASYFQKNHLDLKTRSLVSHIHSIDIVVTQTEKEALLLEQTLIKQNKPRYNVLFKDDKTYAFLALSQDSDFPRLFGERARSFKKGDYFGPYPSMLAVKETLLLLQKIFKLRTCEESVFKNRTRPCLLYQIKRCSGPCVGLISSQDYSESVKHVRAFLKGESAYLIRTLRAEMAAASSRLEFEKAASLRDQLKWVESVQEDQVVDTQGRQNWDILAWSQEGLQFGVVVLIVRQGRVLGSRAYFPRVMPWDAPKDVISSFLEYYYLQSLPEALPDAIVMAEPLFDSSEWKDFMQALLGRCPMIKQAKRGMEKKWLSLSELNVKEALNRYVLEQGQMSSRLEALQHRLSLNQPLLRVECFDISHTQGEATQASCVVYTSEGPQKKAYRRFNITGVTPGDDYAAMRDVLFRRFKRLKQEGGDYPDLVLIDGGKGQLSQAVSVFEALGIPESVKLLGVAKGEGRRAGLERLFWPNDPTPLFLDPHDEAFLLIQFIRNEAHRFAITGHRKKRDQARGTSRLESLPKVGPVRRRALLQHFGGWQALRQASVEALSAVPGISPVLATEIFHALQEKEEGFK